MREPQQYEDWMGGNLNDALLFHGLIFTFDRCDSHGPLPHALLDRIDIHGREDADLFGQPLGTWTKDALVARLKNEGYVPQLGPESAEVPQKLRLAFRDGGLEEVTVTGTPHNLPMQRTGAAGIVSFFQNLIRRGSGR